MFAQIKPWKQRPITQQTSLFYFIINFIHTVSVSFVINKADLYLQANTIKPGFLHEAAAELTPGEGDTFFYEDPSSSHGQPEKEITVTSSVFVRTP